jgi:hypothetical protein
MEGQVPVSDGGGAFINFNLINTQFPEPGRYVVRVSSAGRILVSHTLTLAKISGSSQPDPHQGSQRLH